MGNPTVSCQVLPDFNVGFESEKGEKDQNHLITKQVQSRLRRNAHLSSFVKARPFAALRARQCTSGSFLPFLNLMVLEHSIADKIAAAPQAGKDYFWVKIHIIMNQKLAMNLFACGTLKVKESNKKPS